LSETHFRAENPLFWSKKTVFGPQNGILGSLKTPKVALNLAKKGDSGVKNRLRSTKIDSDQFFQIFSETHFRAEKPMFRPKKPFSGPQNGILGSLKIQKVALNLAKKGGFGGQKSTQIDFFDFEAGVWS
jgi:hypothetical protein